MRVSIETISGLERRLTVTVPAERVDEAVEQRLREVTRNVRLQGFRPGKVPMKVLRQRFGSDVRQEVIPEVIGQSLEEALISENLRPTGQPQIEPRSRGAGKDLEYTASFEIFPTVKINEVSCFTVRRPEVDMTDADVDECVEAFRKQHGELKTVARAAEMGDTVVIDFLGTREGEPFDGGAAQDQSLELGSGKMIAGFEDGIVGMSAGEEKCIDVTFPEEYHNEELRGANAQFKVNVKEVKTLELAPLDEDFFASCGLAESNEEAFRAEVRKSMERQLHDAVQNYMKNQVTDAVLEAHTEVEIPGSLISQEIGAMRSQLIKEKLGDQMDSDMDLKSLLPDDIFEKQAYRRVKLALLFSEMIDKLELRTDPSKVREAIEDIARAYQNPEEIIKWYYSKNEHLTQIESRILEDQMFEKLFENANVEGVRSASYREALAYCSSKV